ncbi:MAG: FAD-binding oxidoreductase, partial [Bacteroidetes bacterium]
MRSGSGFDFFLQEGYGDNSFRDMSVDFLIVGQGLAGSLLAWNLEKAGATVCLLDEGSPRAASRVAAGIVNPLTGRRLAKSWRIDELLPFAKTTYDELADLLRAPLFHSMPIVRAAATPKEANDWMGRAADPAYATYLKAPSQANRWEPVLRPAPLYVEIRGGGRVEMGRLVESLRDHWQKEKCWMQGRMDFGKLHLEGGGIRYEELRAGAVVFCEGAVGRANPHFSWLPFAGVKGEVLLVRMAGFPESAIVKQGLFIVPLGGGVFWVGAGYEHQFEDAEPTAAERRRLEEQLRQIVKLPFEVVSHRAAVRPTTRDRRPFLGRHPVHPELVIFNGLGTKGA